ncbi:MAG: VCBS repeat-containing protein [Bacteroidales bacterium]|nr:VCBS repeat-containing protein [Bacteroidales bacterium]
MKKYISLFLLLFFIGFGANSRIIWKQVHVSQSIDFVIGGESITDYWAIDSSKNVIHIKHGAQFYYEQNDLFDNNSLGSIFPFYFVDSSLFIVYTDKKLNSQISLIRNNKVIKYSFRSKMPIKFIKYLNGNYYAIGDFGLLAMLVNDKWKIIDFPVQKSTFEIVNYKSGVLVFNIRNSGIWSFDGVTFKLFEINKYSNNKTYKLINYLDTVFVEDYSKNIYKLVGDSFVKSNNYNSEIFDLITYASPNEIRYNCEKKLINIPIKLNIKSVIKLKNGQIVINTNDRKIYYSEYVDYNSFRNYASTMGVGGLRYRSSINNDINIHSNVLFADFNNDNKVDIYVIQNRSYEKQALYINDKIFNNSVNSYGLKNYNFDGLIMSAIDINHNNTPELICSESNNNNIKILTKYKNKYIPMSEVVVPEECVLQKTADICFSDIDKDGDADMILTFGYSVNGKGGLYVYYNNGYGYFSEANKSLSELARGWNISSIIADFNNDGLNDILITRNWSNNIVLFQENKNKWRSSKLGSANKDVYYTRKMHSIAFDFDNDGDLDIFCSSLLKKISVYQNNGAGEFTEISSELGLDTLIRQDKYWTMFSADYNNDGYSDLFVGVNSSDQSDNYILLNDSANSFYDYSQKAGVSKGNLLKTLSADIDDDGDVDIFGIGREQNYLWVNDLNNDAFLKVQLIGVKSNSMALGSKIWIYDSGFINDSKHLLAYKQLGSDAFIGGSQSDLRFHFGMGNINKCDIKVEFYGGTIKELLGVHTGKTILIYEEVDFWKYYYSIDNYLYRMVNNGEFVLYFFTIVIGLFFLFIGVYIGYTVYFWNVALTSIIISLDLILFTIFLFLLYDIDSSNRYLIPLSVSVLGSLGPLGVFAWIDRSNNLHSPEDTEYLLFQALQNFSHGEWAASNLNSLQLLFENITVEDFSDDEYLQSYNKRKQTFIEMTAPVLEEIINLSSRLDLYKEFSKELKKQLKGVFYNFSKGQSDCFLDDNSEFSMPVSKIREYLSELKKLVFDKHSCSPLVVYNNISESILIKTEEHNVSFRLINFLEEDDLVLMEANYLADIIDNCVHNALNAMKNAEKKELIIKLIKDDLRFLVSISDSGCGVPNNNKDVIFENGFSTNSSTGFGLYYAKEILSKYGGRIYLKNSEKWIKTTFIIELQNKSDK